MLTAEEISAFARDGFVAVRGAVTAGLARECQIVVWGELESQGVLRDDPATWTAPVVRIPCPEGGPFAVAGTAPRLWEACDQLIGAGRWWRRHGVGVVHAASWPHRGRFPRMIAQPAVTLHGQYALSPRPGDQPPPVEQAILDGLARTRIPPRTTRLLSS